MHFEAVASDHVVKTQEAAKKGENSYSETFIFSTRDSSTPSDSEVHLQSKMTLRAPDLVFSHLSTSCEKVVCTLEKNHADH